MLEKIQRGPASDRGHFRPLGKLHVIKMEEVPKVPPQLQSRRFPEKMKLALQPHRERRLVVQLAAQVSEGIRASVFMGGEGRVEFRITLGAPQLPGPAAAAEI